MSSDDRGWHDDSNTGPNVRAERTRVRRRVGGSAMSIGQLTLLIALLAVAAAIGAMIWSSRQRKEAPVPAEPRRDLGVRIDSVVSGAGSSSDRAVSLVTSPVAASTAADWSAVRADMLNVEGDIVNLDVHLGEAPVGRSLAELERAVHALRDAVDHHVELSTAGSVDEHALSLSQDTVTARRGDVDTALADVSTTRP